MVEWLVGRLKDRFRLAVLSRGYKRRTKGYALARPESSALEIGDEPMQIHLKYPDVPIAVGEKRIEAIPQLLHDHPETEAIILDDAFQHREIRAGLNILLTEYGNLFTRDFYLPVGDLRDLKSSYKRAQIIIITKCIPHLTIEEKNNIIKEISPRPGQQVYFSAIEYGQLYHIFSGKGPELSAETEVLMITGIANPAPLKKLLEERYSAYYELQFADHHVYSTDDLKEIKKRFERIDTDKKIILTTEKDAVRLFKFKKEIENTPVFVMPIRHHFLFNEEDSFLGSVSGFIQNFRNQ
jgi:tetraacyldisaccharide 4'-kinase